MEVTQVHLALTHLPIYGILIGVVILIYGIIAKQEVIKRTALFLFICMALAVVPVFMSGEGAEEFVEHLPGFSEETIHAHEELAEKAIWLVILMGVLSILTLLVMIKGSKYKTLLNWITLLVSIGTLAIMIGVGSLGGKIGHPELNENSKTYFDDRTNDVEEYKTKWDDDDDDDDD